jgi:hypothetical protein
LINHLNHLITFEIKIEFRSKRKGEKGEKENRKKGEKRRLDFADQKDFQIL